MSQSERQRQLNVIAEILLTHLPALLQEDQPLAHDLMAVVATALQTLHEDAERSATAWDKRAYHLRADALRKEWNWVPNALQLATEMALSSAPLRMTSIAKLRLLIRPELKRPARRQISNPARFRGASKALAARQARRREILRPSL